MVVMLANPLRSSLKRSRVLPLMKLVELDLLPTTMQFQNLLLKRPKPLFTQPPPERPLGRSQRSLRRRTSPKKTVAMPGLVRNARHPLERRLLLRFDQKLKIMRSLSFTVRPTITASLTPLLPVSTQKTHLPIPTLPRKIASTRLAAPATQSLVSNTAMRKRSRMRRTVDLLLSDGVNGDLKTIMISFSDLSHVECPLSY